MILVTYAVILISISTLTKVKCGTFAQWNTVFTAIWCSAAALASTGFYDLYKPIPIVHFYVITVIIFFNLAYLLIKDRFRRRKVDRILLGSPRWRFLLLANVLAWLYMIRFISKSYVIIRSGGLLALRSYAFSSSMGLASTAELAISQAIIQPVFVTTIIITLASLVVGRANVLLLIVSVINVALYIFAFAGRSILISFIVYFLLLQIVWNYRLGLFAFLRKILSIGTVAFIIVVLLIFSFLTQKRAWSETNSFKEVYIYTVGSFSLLNAYFDDEQVITQYSPYLYGRAALGMVVNPINMFLTFAFGVPYTGSDYMITRITAVPRAVSPSLRMNALNTMIYPFYRDFGYFGIIFGTVFLASLLASGEILFRRKRTFFSFCFYILILDVVLRSAMNYYLLFPSTGFSIILLALFTWNPKDRTSFDNSGNVVREIENGR